MEQLVYFGSEIAVADIQFKVRLNFKTNILEILQASFSSLVR